MIRLFFFVNLQSNKQGFIGKLQSQVQRSDFNEINNEFNVPESWKWENQTEVNARKERKGNKNRKKKNDTKTSAKANTDMQTE